MTKAALMYAALACLCSFAWAQGDQKEPSRPQVAIPVQYYAEMSKVCDLTDAQAAKVVQIEAKRDTEMSQFTEKNKDKSKDLAAALQEANKSGDTEAVAKAQAAMKNLDAQLVDIHKKADAAVMALLTDKQKAKWADYQVEAAVNARFAKAELNDSQMKQIKEIYAGLVADKPDAAMAALPGKVFNDVMSDTQRMRWVGDQVETLVKIFFSKAELSSDQMKKLKEIYAELARENIDGARGKFMAKVVDEILTDEQKANQTIGTVCGMFAAAKLDDSQVKAVKAAYAELAKDKSLKMDAIQRKLYEKIGATLTDEQKEAMKKAPRFYQ